MRGWHATGLPGGLQVIRADLEQDPPERWTCPARDSLGLFEAAFLLRGHTRRGELGLAEYEPADERSRRVYQFDVADRLRRGRLAASVRAAERIRSGLPIRGPEARADYVPEWARPLDKRG